MAWRRIEVTIKDTSEDDRLGDFLSDLEVFDQQRVESRDALRYLVTLHEEQVESALDQLRDEFAESEGYRAVVIEVAAVDPRPENGDNNARDPERDGGGGLKLTRARISRDELLDGLEPGSKITRVYLVMNALAAVVASAGLVKPSVAMVIGAMVIAPLLLPNMAIAFGTTVGDLRLIRQGVITLAAGVSIVVVVGAIIGMGSWQGWTWPIDKSNDQIGPRIAPDTLDLVVAVAAGAAGAVAVTTGVSANLIGVMVAVALVPPLAALGLMLGLGDWKAAMGAGLNVGITLVSVNLAGVIVLTLQGVRGRDWAQTKRIHAARWVAIPIWALLLALLAVMLWWSRK